MAVFLLIVLSVVGGVHFYLWARLVRDTQVLAPWRAWATAAVVALAVSLPATLMVARRLPPSWAKTLVWPAYVWLGVMFILFTLLLLGDTVRLVATAWARFAGPGPLDPGRRLLLARFLGGGAGASAGILGAFAVRRALGPAEVKEVTVRVPRLAGLHAGTTIAQITDLHVGPTIGRAFVEDVVRRTNALRPDLVAITGDLVDGSVAALRDAIAPLGELRARHGVFFVTGNHEYFSGADAWARELGRIGIRVLRNERVSLPPYELAGIEDFTAGRYDPSMRPDLPRVLEGRDPARPVVLLAHQPKAIAQAAAHGVALQLSGHTHGGQIWPWGMFVRLQQPFVVGLHRRGETQIYVSPGTGYWGPPMRLGTRAEITRLVLQPA
jgi:hypothetical protein